jgi:RNA polymerase sigma-70 factor (ECF subfamily)
MTKTNEIFDALLVLECQAGSKKAMALLVNRWHPKLCKQAYWYTRDSEQAKDIAQDSWGIILKKIHFLRDPNRFGSWALKIVTRKAIDWLRNQKKERINLESNYDLPNPIIDRDDTLDDNPILRVRKAINALPNKQQIILNLFYSEEFSIKQIGEILEISTGTVKSRLFTAREKLKTIFKNRNHEK